MHLEQVSTPRPPQLIFEPLVGQTLEAIDASGAPHSWVFHFSGGHRLTVESLWRLVASGRIVVTGEDHAQRFGRNELIDAAALLRASVSDHQCTDARHSQETGDLAITFGGHGRLEAVVNSSGYESWVLATPDGTHLVATGGGRLVEFRVSAA